MLLKSVAAGALALGLFGAAFSLPASDAASNAVVESQVVESPEVARPTCCAKRGIAVRSNVVAVGSRSSSRMSANSFLRRSSFARS